jgi:adenine-specific DNA methylase
MDKAIIEEGSADLVELFDTVSEEAKIEKLGNAKPPISKIHYWWTRKPLIVGRAVALAATFQKMGDVKDFLRLGRDKRAHTYDPDRELYAQKLGKDPSMIKVLDPFSGAGSLLFEAKRLGLQCHSMDYNPVAFLIEKSVLEYPATYGEKLANDIEKYGKEVIEQTRKQVGYFYERGGRPPLAYLWAWCIRCPYCKQRIPLMNHMWFARKEKKKIGVTVKPTKDLNFIVELNDKISSQEGNRFTQKGGKAVCIRCRNSVSYDHLTDQISKYKDKAMIGVVVDVKNGKSYELPSAKDISNFDKCKILLMDTKNDLMNQDLIPIDVIREYKRAGNLAIYGINQWTDYFNERQLLVMAAVLKSIRGVCNELAKKDTVYAKVIATYLAFIASKHVDYNSIGIGWHVERQQIAHALTFRSPRIIYNFAETNPFGDGSGSLEVILGDIVDAARYASKNSIEAKVVLGSALHIPYPDKTFDIVITDPPYADDVAYGELSEFFYVWLYRALRVYYPELPAAVPLDEDIVLNKGRFGDKSTAIAFYEKAMKEAFKQINRVLKEDGLIVVFFAHSSTEAWNLLLEVLREARLMVTSSYAIHTESTENPLARGKTSFMSSILVSCRKRTTESEAYFEDLVPRMEDKVKELVAGISPDKLISIPMTDLLIMVYGEVLEIATRHAKIKSYDPDLKLDFEVLISRAREQIMKETLTRVLGRSPNVLGPEISFYTIARLFYRGTINGDEVMKLNKAYGVQSSDLENRGIVAINEGNMHLLGYDEIDLGVRPEEIESNNLHKQLVCLEKLAAKEGANKVKKILTLRNFRANDLAQIVSLLIKSYRFLQNKGEELDDIEGKEFKVLQDLADVLGVRDTGAKNLDGFIEK